MITSHIPALLSAAIDFPHKLATLLAVLGGYLLYTRYGRASTRGIPGPWLASVSNLYRFCDQWSQQSIRTLIELHEKHGTFVRYGPNLVSISDPEGIAEVYGVGRGYIKSEFYPVQQTMSNGQSIEGMFNTTSEALHTSLRRPVAGMYSQSTLTGYEPLVDSTIRCFEKRMNELFTNDAVCDWGMWLQFFAFDVIGELTFGNRLGFLDTGTDVEGVMAGIERHLEYAALVGQLPWLDVLLRKNPLMAHFASTTSYVARFSLKHLESHLASSSSADKPRPDFLTKFVQAHQKAPDKIPRSHIVSWTVSNLNAGSDTTAIALRTIFYFLLKNPASLQKLLAEIAAAEAQGVLTEGEIVSWNQSQQLPFLDAVVREAMRLHPAVGMMLERVVPAGGREICGRRFEAGTVVGMSAWVVHRDKSVFGADAEVWRPERWIEADEESKKRMDGRILAFGAGARTCIGKNISRLEMYKFVPQILRDYEITLADPKSEWKLSNHWFVRQSGFMVKLRRRIKAENSV